MDIPKVSNKAVFFFHSSGSGWKTPHFKLKDIQYALAYEVIFYGNKGRINGVNTKVDLWRPNQDTALLEEIILILLSMQAKQKGNKGQGENNLIEYSLTGA